MIRVVVVGRGGTGKTSFVAAFVDAACRRGEKCLYMALEETEDQIVRNMRSICSIGPSCKPSCFITLKQMEIYKGITGIAAEA